jgi:acetyl esterase/lipase
MQNKEPGKSNLKFPDLRVKGANSMSRKYRKSFIALWLFSAILHTSAVTQEARTSGTEQVFTTKVIDVWPGVAPGSEQWKQQETVLGSGSNQRIVNVTKPTLTAYLPPPSTATGAAVIIAPGGGFVYLTIDSEGHDVAKWLVARGIAAIVLKYRVIQIEGQDAAQLNQAASAAIAANVRDLASIDENGKYGIADGIQAVKIVRAHSTEWGIAPNHIVFTGFSAGAVVTAFTALRPDARPNYAAPIYGGPMTAMPPIPQGLPPFFLAVAQDDNGAGPAVARFYEALKAAGYRPELHVFSSGGHGFGMRKQGRTSDHWIDEFYYWLEAQGLTRPAR